MHDLRIPADTARRVLAAAAAVSGAPDHPRVERFLVHLAREVGVDPEHGRDADPGPDGLAAVVADEAREAVVERLILAAMLAPPLDDKRLSRLERHAAALGRAAEPALKDLRRAAAGRRWALTSGLMSRFPPGERLKAAWRRGGLKDRWRLLKALARLPDATTARRYRALADLPAGTLGRAFVDHCRAHGFPLPGERGGLPEAGIFHDMGHALLGCGIDIAGETEIGGFEAGTMGARGFVMLEFALLLFNLGAPLPTNAKPQVDRIDVDILFAGFARGRASSLDVLAWDPWEDVHEPVAALRQRYGIQPAA